MALSLDDLQFVVCEPGARSIWSYAKTEIEAQEIADNRELATGKKYVVEPYDDFDKRQTTAWLDDVPLQEITPDFYDQMMNVLPPMYRAGAMGFFMCEFTAGTITNQFVSRRTSDFSEPRYYVKAVDITDRTTWITPEKIAALPDGPRLEWFGRKLFAVAPDGRHIEPAPWDGRHGREAALDRMKQAIDRDIDTCSHEWRRAGSVGLCVCYECTKCGEEMERDVS